MSKTPKDDSPFELKKAGRFPFFPNPAGSSGVRKVKGIKLKVVVPPGRSVVAQEYNVDTDYTYFHFTHHSLTKRQRRELEAAVDGLQ